MNCYDKSLEPIYKKLGIDIKKCFCTMMNVEWSDQQKKVWESMFTDAWAEPYESKDKSWIKWLVYENHPHITILYGSLDGVTPDMVKTALSWWEPEGLTISEISYFDSPDGEPYYCIIAKVEVTENLCDARSRLELLPHINTFPDYKAHITLWYIKKDQKALSNILWINKKRTSVAPFTATPTGVVYDNNSWDPVTIL